MGRAARNKETGTTELEEAYCQILADPEWNGTLYEAYALAGYSTKGSKKNVETKARTLAGKDHIVMRIAAIQAQAASDNPDVIPDAALVLARLAEEVNADIKDLFTDTGVIRPIKEWPRVWRQGLVSSLKVKQTKNTKGKVTGAEIVELKIAVDKSFKRLELLGKHHQLWQENLNVTHTGEIGIKQIKHEYLSPPQLDEDGNFPLDQFESEQQH